MLYRGADKSLARPGRKQANVSFRMARIYFCALLCRERNLMTARVSILLKSRACLTCFRACFLPGRAKDLTAPRYQALYALFEAQTIRKCISLRTCICFRHWASCHKTYSADSIRPTQILPAKCTQINRKLQLKTDFINEACSVLYFLCDIFLDAFSMK